MYLDNKNIGQKGILTSRIGNSVPDCACQKGFERRVSQLGTFVFLVVSLPVGLKLTRSLLLFHLSSFGKWIFIKVISDLLSYRWKTDIEN